MRTVLIGRESKWKSCCSCDGRETEAREMTESERAVIPQAERPSISARTEEKKKGGRERERDGLLKSRVHLSHSFLFILLVCFFSPLLISNIPPLPPYFFPPSSTHFRFALFQFLAPPPLHSPTNPPSPPSLLSFLLPLPPKGKEILPAAR